MADYPYFPVWTDAYLADTTHLSDAEHGRYLMMLFHMWRMPEKRFPNDDQWLARKFGRTVAQIETDYRPLLVEFFKSDGNWITHKRLVREWQRVRRTRARQSGNAKARWDKDKTASHGTATVALHPEPEPEPRKKDSESRINESFLPRTTAAHNGAAEKRGCRLGNQWQPSEQDIAEAKRLGLSEQDAKREADRFRDYWIAQPGQRGVKVDWPATWRNWCRKAATAQQPTPRKSTGTWGLY